MQTTLEVDDLLFSKLFLDEKLQSDGSASLLTPSPPDSSSQVIVIDRLSSSVSSSVEAGRTPDSDSLQPPPLGVVFRDGDVTPDTPSLPNTLSYKAGDHVLLMGSCNLSGRYGVPIGLNLNTGLSGAFCLSSARRVPKSYAWTTHRYVLSPLWVGICKLPLLQ